MPAGTFTVPELAAAISHALEVCFPDDVWVEGEISSLQSRPVANESGKRHIFFDLIEPGAPRGGPVLPVRLFDSQRQRVNAFLRRQGSIKMSDGVRVRISGRLQHYGARSQVVLHMRGIDPGYTLAMLASERDRVLRVLATDGLLDRNRAVPLAPVPLRVGLVTSAHSAAAADFLDELRGSGFAWRVVVADTRVQGAGAEASIAAAIASFGPDRPGGPVDAIAVVRGGGARTELATFDSELVARAIATAAVPVLTGIGHEIDDAVADRVAHGAFKTPTACAAALVDHVGAFVARTEAVRADLHRAALRATSVAGIRVHRSAERLQGLARLQLAGRRHALDRAAGHVRRDPVHRLDEARRRLDAIDQRTRALDPARALARGWTITTDDAGRVLRSTDQVKPGLRIHTRLADGTVTSTVTETVPGAPPARATEPTGDDDDGV